jgi:ADP-ribose diphosphatase
MLLMIVSLSAVIKRRSMSDQQNKTTTKLPTIHNAKLVAQSRFFKIEELDLEFTNGEQRVYERMKGSGRGAVMVVPVINNEEFYLVSEYGAGTHNYQLGFPKGLIDEGETPEQAANRELKEEIGFGAKKLVKLKTLTAAPSYFDSKMHIYLAFDLYPEKLPGDEPEPLEVITWAWRDAEKLLAREDFSEARSVSALFMAKQRLNLE